MTHTTQVLSDDEMWILWNAQGSDEMNKDEAIAFARAIESATLKAVSGQEPVGEIAACLPDGVGMHVSWLAHSGQKLRVGDKLFALPPAQPAPVDEREAFEAWAQSQNGDIDRRKRGDYLCDETQARWHAWQARAALQCAQAPQPTKGQP